MRRLLTSAFFIQAAFMVIGSAPSRSLDAETLNVARDLQAAERSIAIAINTNDVAALRRFSSHLLGMHFRIPETEEASLRSACIGAAGSLRNLAEDMSQPGDPRMGEAGIRDRDLYLEKMPICEAAVGLAAPSGITLRVR